mgnify:CR=1 FL=1
MKKIAIATLLLLTSLGIYYYPSLSNTLYIASGFSAKNICSGHFLSGFNPDQITEQALIPINDAFKMVDYQIDENEKTVTTHIAGMFERLAIYRQGLGCTLLAIGQKNLDTNVIPLIPVIQSELKPWPLGLAKIEEEENSIDYNLLNQAIDRAFSESESNGKRNVKAIAIIHQGKLIAERYATGVNAETPLLSWSMAKSITNLQVGLLVKAGKLDLFAPATVPQWKDSQDPRSKITLDQLMRMSSGLEFNETYGINTDVSSMLSVKADTGGFAADKPLKYAPDTHWSYSSGTTNIIAGIIKRTLGGNFQDYYEFTQKQLFMPLGISTALLETDANDTFIGSSFIYATARDWAKFGQLMLQNGQWNGQQLLAEDWVKYSTTATQTAPLNQYGAQFWLNSATNLATEQRKWPTVPTDAYYMGGYQGQYVVVIPSKELVIVRLGFTKPGTTSGIEKLLADVINLISEQ